jgi:negative regulator of flagellin synthesis FlgM
VATGKATPVANDTARAHAAPQSAVQRSAALDPGEVPVDAERVAEIRKAIERGHYPVLPAKVADAMIAAGLLLRSGK